MYLYGNQYTQNLYQQFVFSFMLPKPSKKKLLLIVVSLIAIAIFFYAAIKTTHGNEKKILFPKDEGRHDAPIESWQISMHFKDLNGRNYSSWAQYIRNEDRKLRRISLTDGKKYYSENMARNFYCSKGTLNLTCDNDFSISDKFYRSKGFSYKIYIAFESKGKKIILSGNLFANKKPVIFAEGGAPSFLNLSTISSIFFYSIPNLNFSGNITIDNETKKINGRAWIEHIWGEFFIPPWIKWNIQLNNSYEILIIRLPLKKWINICYLIFPDGHVENITGVEIKDAKRWKTIGKTYVTKWLIRSKNFSLFVNATLQDQVMIGTLSYIGSCTVSGEFFSKKVMGMCYVEEI